MLLNGTYEHNKTFSVHFSQAHTRPIASNFGMVRQEAGVTCGSGSKWGSCVGVANTAVGDETNKALHLLRG